MRVLFLLILTSFFFKSYSQLSLSGLYVQETICCSCKLKLRPNSNFNLHCKRHHLNPLIEKGKWFFQNDTIYLKTDSSTNKLLIKSEGIIVKLQDDTLGGVYLEYRAFVNIKSYHNNWVTAAEKSWININSSMPLKSGEWKYFNNKGKLEKTLIYKKGKLKKIKPTKD